MLKPIVGNIRRMLDLDVDIQQIDELFKDKYSAKFNVVNGLRLPGIWSPFEAGIRAILGQQVTVTAAHKLVDKLVNELGVYIDDKVIFPTPQSIAESDFSFLKMPLARKQTLRNLAQHYLDSDTPNDVNKWEELKGIGPWTMDYVRMRGLSDPNIFLAQDSGVKNAISKMEHDFNSEYGSPWRSYLTFQLWNQLV